jgi:hypothetical protein
MVSQVAATINQFNKGVKSRFTHPSMSGDGLGRFLGRVMDARVEGDHAVADLHFSAAGHRTPDGDLADYLMTMAEADPDMLGVSIVFTLDEESMAAFSEANSRDGVFVSPDQANTRNLRHARLAALRAADVVDEPAANPAGLFHRENEVLDEAETLADFAIGLRAERPQVVLLGMDPDRVRGFVARFLSSRQLALTPLPKESKETMMAETESTQADQDTEQPPAAVETESTPGEAEAVEQNEDAAVASEAQPLAEPSGQQFLDEFGSLGGVWFAEGKTYDEARTLYTAHLKAQLELAEQQISALRPTGELSPVAFCATEDARNSAPYAGRISVPGH